MLYNNNIHNYLTKRQSIIILKCLQNYVLPILFVDLSQYNRPKNHSIFQMIMRMLIHYANADWCGWMVIMSQNWGAKNRGQGRELIEGWGWWNEVWFAEAKAWTVETLENWDSFHILGNPPCKSWTDIW